MLKKLIVSVAAAWAFSASGQGIPVIDVAAIAQAIQQLLAWEKQYQQMYEQLQNLRQQLSTAESQLSSTTGTRNLGQLYNAIPRPALDPALMRSLQQGESAGQVVSASKAQLAALQGDIEARSRQIQQLMNGINATSDLKGVQEISARIASEQVMVTSEGNSATVLAQTREMRLRELDQIRSEELLRRLSAPNGFGR